MALKQMELTLTVYQQKQILAGSAGKKHSSCSEKEHTLRVAENATKVTLTFKAPAGCTLTVNGKASNGTYVADVRSGQADVTVKTTLNGKSRDYIFHLTSGLGNSSWQTWW